MTQADKIFIETCKRILSKGISSVGTEVRPRWEDGTAAHTISLVGVTNEYDLSKGFPMITLRKSPWKSALDELLWIWQKKSNNIHDLNSNVWNEWADKDGSIGKAYGYQMAKKYSFKTKEGIQIMDQVDYVLYLLKNDPASRRIMTNIFVHQDLSEMNLEPCVYGTQWLVKNGMLNLILNQRSQDMLAANGWNTMQYAALAYILAHVNGLKPGVMTHVIGDCHIYDRHIPLVEQLIEQKTVDCQPKFLINPDKKDFYSLTMDDFQVTGYDYNKETDLGKIPIAV